MTPLFSAEEWDAIDQYIQAERDLRSARHAEAVAHLWTKDAEARRLAARRLAWDLVQKAWKEHRQ